MKGRQIAVLRTRGRERTTSNQRTSSFCSERGVVAAAGGAMTFLPDTGAGDDRMKVTQHTTTSAMAARIQPSSFQTASRRFTVVRLSAMLGADPGHSERTTRVLLVRRVPVPKRLCVVHTRTQEECWHECAPEVGRGVRRKARERERTRKRKRKTEEEAELPPTVPSVQESFYERKMQQKSEGKKEKKRDKSELPASRIATLTNTRAAIVASHHLRSTSLPPPTFRHNPIATDDCPR